MSFRCKILIRVQRLKKKRLQRLNQKNTKYCINHCLILMTCWNDSFICLNKIYYWNFTISSYIFNVIAKMFKIMYEDHNIFLLDNSHIDWGESSSGPLKVGFAICCVTLSFVPIAGLSSPQDFSSSVGSLFCSQIFSGHQFPSRSEPHTASLLLFPSLHFQGLLSS